VEPWLAQVALEGLVRRYSALGNLELMRGVSPHGAQTNSDRIVSVEFRDSDGRMFTVEPELVLDATDEGDLLAIAQVEFVTGFESRRDTGEPSAPDRPQPENVQAITHAFAVEHCPGEDHTVEKPKTYDQWRAVRPPGWPGPLIGWSFPDPRTGRPVELPFTPNASADVDRVTAHAGDSPSDRDLWRYRRVLARNQLSPAGVSDVTIVNWPMNDYFLAPVVTAVGEARGSRLQEARDLSLSLLYWLQKDAPRPDGGVGWPGLRLRGDVVGTHDGFAKRPYTRESRRIRAEVTVAEQDISRAVRGPHGAVRYADSVGAGYYRIDLHPSTGGDLYLDVDACPFEVPLGALIPRRVDNLVAAAKNIGTTHITNGCYRVHPVEWTIGEAAGTLAAFCTARHVTPRWVRNDPSLLGQYQQALVSAGAQLHWRSAS
jgi:hypothetical protein